jgi:hypothetical protein
MNIHALNGIRTRDPCNKAAAVLRLRAHGQWDRLVNAYNSQFLSQEKIVTGLGILNLLQKGFEPFAFSVVEASGNVMAHT